MRIKSVSFVLLCIVFSAFVLLVGAGSIGGFFSFSGGSLSVDGSLVGFEPNGGGVVTIDATASVTAICQNPGGQSVAHHASLQLSHSQSVQADANGNAGVNIFIGNPTAGVAGNGKAAGCPSDKFTILNYENASWSNVHIKVLVNGVVELDNMYSCSDNGTLSCSLAG